MRCLRINGPAHQYRVVRTLLLIALTALPGAACSAGVRASSRGVTASTHGQRDEITLAEIRQMRQQPASAYDIVKTLRPRMLLRRTQSGIEAAPVMQANELPGLHVHIDDVGIGDVGFLATIPARAVASILWLSPSQASTKFGNGHNAGVIAVTTLTGRW